MVIDLGVNNRRILRRHSRFEGVARIQGALSMRDIIEFTIMPPAHVKP